MNNIAANHDSFSKEEKIIYIHYEYNKCLQNTQN